MVEGLSFGAESITFHFVFFPAGYFVLWPILTQGLQEVKDGLGMVG